jgi:hypothetical protein
MGKKESTAVAAKPEQALAVIQSDEVPDYIKNEQRGSENVSTEDIVIPRLELIQALSPAVKEGDPGFIAEARPGMLMNSVTKQLYGKEVMVVPIVFMKQWLVWKKRKYIDPKSGKEVQTEGGFLGAFNSPEDAKARAAEEPVDPAQIEIIDTPQHLCLLINFNSGTYDEVMLSMPRTKAKISRQWNSMIRLAGGDRFSRVYRITSAIEKKTKGDYYNFVVAQSGWPAKPIYNRAEKLWEQIQAGTRKVAMDVSDFDEADDTNAPDDTEM